MRKGVDTHALLTLFATLLAVALPLQILVAGTSIAHPDPEQFAELHRQNGFWLRATLTFLYFPAAIVLHLLVQAAVERRRTAFLAGFYLFLLGNGIDLLFRSIQFLVAHACGRHSCWRPSRRRSVLRRVRSLLLSTRSPRRSASPSLFYLLSAAASWVVRFSLRRPCGHVSPAWASSQQVLSTRSSH